MARVTVIFEDKPGGTVIQMESDPPFSVDSSNVEESFKDATPAQASAFGAVMEVAGLAQAYEIFVQKKPVI